MIERISLNGRSLTSKELGWLNEGLLDSGIVLVDSVPVGFQYLGTALKIGTCVTIELVAAERLLCVIVDEPVDDVSEKFHQLDVADRHDGQDLDDMAVDECDMVFMWCVRSSEEGGEITLSNDDGEHEKIVLSGGEILVWDSNRFNYSRNPSDSGEFRQIFLDSKSEEL